MSETKTRWIKDIYIGRGRVNQKSRMTFWHDVLYLVKCSLSRLLWESVNNIILMETLLQIFLKSITAEFLFGWFGGCHCCQVSCSGTSILYCQYRGRQDFSGCNFQPEQESRKPNFFSKKWSSGITNVI